jgi:hypothetical protein
MKVVALPFVNFLNKPGYMKKKISKLQLKKTVVTIMGTAAEKNRGEGLMATNKPVFSCLIICLPTFNGCPPPPDTTGP